MDCWYRCSTRCRWFLLPRHVHVDRSVSISAPPAKVFSIVNDLKTYDDWMPWNRVDPNMKKQYGDKTTGPGAWYTWQSDNKSVGHGKFQITSAVPDQQVTCALTFADMAPSVTGWNLKGNEQSTRIDWFMDADMGMNPAGRWFGLFFDKMVGPDFTKGLDSLKKMAETMPSPVSTSRD